MFMVFPESCKVYVCERGKEGRKERERERERKRERERERETKHQEFGQLPCSFLLNFINKSSLPQDSNERIK